MRELKGKIIIETYELVFFTTYLFLFLSSLTIYRSILMTSEVFSFYHIGYNFVEALLLAKIILIGKMFKLGERYSDRSLIIPTLYKAIFFSLFVFLFTFLEHTIFGYFEGKSIALVWREFVDKGLNQSLGKLLIAFLFFILLFSFEELTQVLGKGKIFKLFFRRDKS